MVNIISKQSGGLATKWHKLFAENHFLKTRILITLFMVFALALFLVLTSSLVYIFFIAHIPEESYVHEVGETLLYSIVFIDSLMMFFSIPFLYIATKKILDPIERMTKQQNELIANVSHELRTPLALMLSSIDTTLLKNRTAEKYKAVLQTQRADVQYLKKLSDNILYLECTRIDTDKNIINLSNIAQNVLHKVQSYAQEKNISITQDIKNKDCTIIHGNKTQLTQLMLNLLKNALDYSPKNTSVSLTLSCKQKEVILTITDHGIGMSKEELKHAQERFYKADTARHNTGTGLGLSIVQAIAQAHNAKLYLQSKKDLGTTVSVTFLKISS